MKTYVFKTTATMKPYNNENWWIDGDIVTEKMFEAENITEALEKYQELVKEDHFIIISPNALKNKQPMYVDTIEGVAKQCGYVITAKDDFMDDFGNWKFNYIDLWVRILTVVDTDMEMNVGHLRECLQGLDDDMPVYVACNGECNCDFEKRRPREGTDTFAIVHNGAVFITDENAVDTGYGGIL